MAMVFKVIREFIGYTTVLLAAISYVPYLIDIFRNRTKPHAFSWLVWGSLTGVGFGIAATNDGGAGAWQLGFTATVCMGIFLLALWRGEKDIHRADWMCLLGAGIAGALWLMTDNVVLSAILITVIDAIGFIPTFRKSFMKPHQETLSTQVVGIAKHGLSITALNKISVATALYPLSLFVMNFAFAIFLVVRRRQLGLHPASAKREDPVGAPLV